MAVIRAYLGPYLGETLPVVFFIVPVILAAWYGGLRVGLFATAASLLVGWLLFVDPRFAIVKGDLNVLLRFTLFAAFGAGISMMGSRARRSKREARRSETRFRSTFENAAVGMALVGLDGRWLHVNERLCAILGYSAGELRQLKVGELAHPEDRASALQWSRALLAGETGGYSVEQQYRRKEGPWVWANLTVSLQRDDHGKPEYFIAVVENITVRKEAEEALRVNLKQLQATFEGMVEPAMLLDKDANVIAVNSAYLHLFDFVTPPKAWNEMIADVEFSNADGSPIAPDESPFSHAVRGEVVRSLEVKGRNRKTGKAFHILSGSAPVRDAEGNIAAVILTSHDILERMRTEQALQRSNLVLRQFAYAAAHDLQEPLRNVAISCELLARRYAGQLDGQADRLLDTSIEGARRMHRMVNDLLDYTKIIDPSVSAPPLVDAAASLAQAIRNLEQSIQHTEATVTHDALPALPVHSTHLVQLFQNLISNSLKYRRPEEPPRVHITATRDGGDWLFAVNDNGIGFDPLHAERIFGLFKRLHTRGEYPGTGIGLAICTRIVEHYGGRIWADAVPGRGATFFFALPAGEGR